MDIRERTNDFQEAVRAAIDDRLAAVWTTLPVTVESFDAGAQTVSLKPAIKGFIKLGNGKQKAVDLPLLQSVPVQYPAGGGMTFTHPIQSGDEGLVVFSARSPDTWHQSGGDQIPADAATHGLSGGFFIPGVRSQPKALKDISTTAAEIRSDDGKTRVSISGAAGVGINTDKGVAIAAAGNVTMTGTLTVTGDVIANGVSLVHHTHGGVQPGGGNTAEPNH